MKLWEQLMRRWAARLGYGLAPLPQKSERLDIHLQTLFERLGINCVFDVGANRGQYGRFLRDLGFNGRIISFEPVTADYAHLQEAAAADPGWHTHRLALGDSATTAAIHVTSDSLFNSFLAPNDFIRGQGLKIDDTEEVPVQRLDAIFDDCLAGLEAPRIYLKLDTQGYDLKVLAGAAAVLPRITALQSELSVKPVYEEMPYYLDSIKALQELGFEVTGLFPIARDNALRVVEFDCVLVQTAVAGQTTGLFPA